MIRAVQVIVLAAVTVFLAAPKGNAAPAGNKPKAQAASREALYQQCRQEAFRKFGWHNGQRLVLYTDFLVQQTDLCVRNGGHF